MCAAGGSPKPSPAHDGHLRGGRPAASHATASGELARKVAPRSARSSLAEEITRIHCDATGIPRSYVNVMFTDVPAGRYFVAGKPSGHSVISGAIRLGRDVGTRQRILRELSRRGRG